MKIILVLMMFFGVAISSTALSVDVTNVSYVSNYTNETLSIKSGTENSPTIQVGAGQTVPLDPKMIGYKNYWLEISPAKYCDPKKGVPAKVGIGGTLYIYADGSCSLEPKVIPPPVQPTPPGKPVFNNLQDRYEVSVGNTVNVVAQVTNNDGSANNLTVAFSPTSAGGITPSYSNGVITFSGKAGAGPEYGFTITATSTLTSEVQVASTVFSVLNNDGLKPVVPRSVSAWIYDASGTGGLGQFVSQINDWNTHAGSGDKIIELHTYGTDMEMWGEAPNFSLETYYSPPNKYQIGATEPHLSLMVGPYNLMYYKQHVADATYMSPIVDGRTDTGYLKEFNSISLTAVVEYADLLAMQTCLDGRLDGLQIDVEPLNFVVTNGESNIPNQVAFYLRLVDNFSSISRDPTLNSYAGISPLQAESLSICSAKHRYVSVFTFAQVIEAAITNPNVEASMATLDLLQRDNFLVIDSLYDLPPGAPPATESMVSINDYYQYVQDEVKKMVELGETHKFNYKFGIPASCSFHECETVDGAVATQKQYVLAAINAIGKARVWLQNNKNIDMCNSKYFKGITIWTFNDDTVTFHGKTFHVESPTNYAGVVDALIKPGVDGTLPDGSPAKTGMSNAIGCSVNQ